MKTGIISIALLLISFSLTSGEWIRQKGQEEGQDPKWVLSQIEKFYSSHPFMYHELEYILYPDHSSTIPHSMETGVFITDGSRQYSRLSMIESLVTKEFVLSIDAEDKIMVISNRVHIPPTHPVAQFEHFLSDGTELKMNPLSDILSELVIISDFGEVQESGLVYNIITFEPVKLVLKYRRPIQISQDSDTEPVAPRLEVNYMHTDLNGKGSDKLNLNRYVSNINGEWKVTPFYKTYELINNIQSINIHN